MEKYTEFYVSVDVETSGPIPGDYFMSAIGAYVAGARTSKGEIVTFDHHDDSLAFYSELQPLEDAGFIAQALNVGGIRGFDASLFKFADDEAAARYRYLSTHGEDIYTSMSNFAEFVKNHAERLDSTPVFVAYPLGFDWMFVYWYMVHCGVQSPFGFSRALDVKSLYAGAFNRPLTKASEKYMKAEIRRAPERAGVEHTHFADQDAKGQGLLAMKLLEVNEC